MVPANTHGWSFNQPLNILKLVALIFLLSVSHSGQQDSLCPRALTGNFSGENAPVWQYGRGCSLHDYTKKEFYECIRRKNEIENDRPVWLVFYGDSKTKYFIHYIANKTNLECQIPQLNINEAMEDGSLLSKAYYKKVFSKTSYDPISQHVEIICLSLQPRLQINFYWEKFFYDSRIVDLFSNYQEKFSVDHFVFGINLHYPRVYPIAQDSHMKEQLTNDLLLFKQMSENKHKRSTIIWKEGESVDEKSLPAFKRPFLKNWRVDWVNKATLASLNNSDVLVWDVPRTALNHFQDWYDGVHYNASTYELSFQSLVNYMCNKVMNIADSQCCHDNEFIQRENGTRNVLKLFRICGIALLFGATLLFLANPVAGKILKKGNETNAGKEYLLKIEPEGVQEPKLPKQSGNTCFQRIQKLVHHLLNLSFIFLKLLFIMSFCLLCDRYHIFESDEKSFSAVHFWVPMAGVFALGLATVRSSEQTSLLNRNITDEWKGWMQAVILIYHFTEASKNIMIYMHIRVLVSAYLFLTGYGHYLYANSDKKMGLKRYLQVMFRMNFLTVLLCLVMEKPYIFYYFVPLISFWYTSLYVLLWLPLPFIELKSFNHPRNQKWLWLKLLLFFQAISYLSYSETFQRAFGFWPIGHVFEGRNGSLHEWQFRWKLDQFSVIYGTVFGMALASFPNFYDNNSKKSSSSIYSCLLTVLLPLAGLCSYVFFSKICGEKEHCNRIHPFITWIPIASYIAIRNLSESCRKYSSQLFSWLGRISLELFICQYHIWLTNDTQSVLVILPGMPLVNGLATSVLLALAAHEMHQITSDLSALLFPQ